ncbi:MAG TPA: hypothetical protein VK502_02255, partial [Candidatus Saccharimonadales bacterium]|nr:hypothetical protein [Candidatus Saccharimonadales bacterium]
MLVFAAATLAVSFAYIFLTAPLAHAADATWTGASITYNGNQYGGPTTLPVNNTSGLPANTQVYIWNEGSGNNDAQKVHIIYFGPGADASKATTAKYVEYLYTPPDTYASPSAQKDITIDPATYGQNVTQCAVDGIGWWVCTIATHLADGMDWIFDTLRTFVEVEPMGIGPKGDLYIAWDIMRGFANILFIVGFLVVVYSQLTNVGLSNYGIKKILPRLIIAAIMVNISYYVCAVAIDLSNIAGTSLQDILINIRKEVFQINDGTLGEAINWKNMTAFILSGGTVATIASLTALSAVGGSVVSAVFALVPLLVGLLVIILVVLIILAARQALIIMLVILSPLACVAYLLPGTEKWGKKWQEAFMNMLIFFPAFSMIFGGSQFAGSIIIQNATSIIMILFGMAVQVAPLALVPFILKLSTGLLGRIAGIVNDPRKGVMDRTKNWAKDHQENHKQRGIGGNLKRRNGIRRFARRREMGKKNLERSTERWKQGFEAYSAQKVATSKKLQKVERELEISKIKTENWQKKTKQAIDE